MATAAATSVAHTDANGEPFRGNGAGTAEHAILRLSDLRRDAQLYGWCRAAARNYCRTASAAEAKEKEENDYTVERNWKGTQDVPQVRIVLC